MRTTIQSSSFPFVLIPTLLCLSLGLTSGQEIKGDLESTQRINARLCSPGGHSPENSRKFFCCYDTTKGKPQFVTCQLKLFGHVFNDERTLDAVCTPPVPFTQYLECLESEFKVVGLDLTEELAKVNVCQAKIYGI